MEEVIFVTDEVEDVLESLRHVRVCLKETHSNPHAWKWVAISLFCAVQGAIVCHATGFSGLEALRKEHAEIEETWLRGKPTRSGLPPVSDLAAPESLWKRMVGGYADYLPAGGIISASEDQETAFHYFKHLRDGLLHFTPKTWIIGASQIRRNMPPMLDLLDEIIDRGFAFRHADACDFKLKVAEIREMIGP